MSSMLSNILTQSTENNSILNYIHHPNVPTDEERCSPKAPGFLSMPLDMIIHLLITFLLYTVGLGTIMISLVEIVGNNFDIFTFCLIIWWCGGSWNFMRAVCHHALIYHTFFKWTKNQKVSLRLKSSSCHCLRLIWFKLIFNFAAFLMFPFIILFSVMVFWRCWYHKNTRIYKELKMYHRDKYVVWNLGILYKNASMWGCLTQDLPLLLCSYMLQYWLAVPIGLVAAFKILCWFKHMLDLKRLTIFYRHHHYLMHLGLSSVMYISTLFTETYDCQPVIQPVFMRPTEHELNTLQVNDWVAVCDDQKENYDVCIVLKTEPYKAETNLTLVDCNKVLTVLTVENCVIGLTSKIVDEDATFVVNRWDTNIRVLNDDEIASYKQNYINDIEMGMSDTEEAKIQYAANNTEVVTYSEIQDEYIPNVLITTKRLLNLINQLESGATIQNLIAVYGDGDDASDSYASQKGSDNSGDSKHNSEDEKRNNNNDNHDSNDNNGNDDHHKKDNNNDENKQDECMIHQYGCNVAWHAERLKELEEENMVLKKLLDRGTASDDNAISSEKCNKLNKTELLHETINLKISKRLTKTEIPCNIGESICDVVGYVNKYMHIYHESATQDYKCDDGEFKVIDCDIHDKKTQEKLYLVCASNDTETSWRMAEDLYSVSKLEEIYKISRENVSFSVAIDDKICTELRIAKQQINHILQNKTERDNIIGNKKTPWGKEDKIPIFNKVAKQTGLILSLQKHQFVQRVKEFADANVNNMLLVPIVRFDDNNNYFYEIAWIVQIGENINIAISFKCVNNKYLPSGIYLNIYDQHKLVAYNHDCKCSVDFNCIIDVLQIGQSKEKRTHQSYKRKTQQRINEYENEMQNYSQLKQDMLVVQEIKQMCYDLQKNLQSLQQNQHTLSQQQEISDQLIRQTALNAILK